MYKVGFALIGGVHQFLHGIPVAAILEHRPDVRVQVFVPSASDAKAARAMLGELGAPTTEVTVLRLPAWIEALVAPHSARMKLKKLRLVWWRRHLRRLDCLVATERTSACLARLPGRCPPLIQIPHGVGGARRAGGNGMDPRFSAFDLALVAGAADVRTTLAHRLLPPERVAAVGQVKLAGLKRLGRLDRKRLFDNDRPTILYNPHFHGRRGSWTAFGRQLIEAVGRDGGFNLIVAPHVRLFATAPRHERETLANLSYPDWLIVDPGSARSCDMTYTLAADIYVGDFSSQLYEWLIYPRPCVFIDQIGDGGGDDSKLGEMWRLGRTVSTMDDLLAALHSAACDHHRYKELQVATMIDAVGDLNAPADVAAADRIIRFLDGACAPTSDR